ncbi:hypothetical protein CY0110_16377 [Crocosphaera chwakensis CCY0110]|uniref:Uncharacterized protein n=1 Tax=Crocosphaera chwakensis CCY0110 TaxID=391612 RepID=A3IHV7_9CHRO|nr:hypothetical protein CY0110_16377 [Crocosphaera chwakensis CCY0110]
MFLDISLMFLFIPLKVHVTILA